MKTLKEIQKTDLNVQKAISMHLRYLKEFQLDWDVFLPSKNMNLQRDFVWNLDQKRELIWSMILERNIPTLSFIVTKNDTYQVIDGKQRLSTMLDFIDNKFTILIDDVEYFLKDLPIDYQSFFKRFMIRCDLVYEQSEPLTDQQKIEWFYLLNFAGTQIEKEHLEKLRK